jgi:predicted secreted acid phosphatase
LRGGCKEKNYEIILLVGDNLADQQVPMKNVALTTLFGSDSTAGSSAQNIVLPNTMYGNCLMVILGRTRQ